MPPESLIVSADGYLLTLPDGSLVTDKDGAPCCGCGGGCHCGCCEIPGNKCTFSTNPPDCTVLSCKAVIFGGGIINWSRVDTNGCGIEGSWSGEGDFGPAVATSNSNPQCPACKATCTLAPERMQNEHFALWTMSTQFRFNGPNTIAQPGDFTNIPPEGVTLAGQSVRLTAEFRSFGFPGANGSRVDVRVDYDLQTGQAWWQVFPTFCDAELNNRTSTGTGSMTGFSVTRTTKGCPVGFRADFTTAMDVFSPQFEAHTDGTVYVAADFTGGPLGCGEGDPNQPPGTPGFDAPLAVGGQQPGALGGGCGGCGQDGGL